ncbi:hypothetical protein [Photobacterium profundum]|uniref:Uncharacterized protein n=1 Tax=Photobacterium profundum (strain SS9) TaxID=298386 RepID=Q6LH35_PHOPR|nr:hypothetical protein [Photobacterium profundum]CAG23395.1 Hypothetical protein PBPRB1532 [Photobacterium profundum SS9]
MHNNIIFFEKDQDCRWISKEISDVFPLYLYDETEFEGKAVTFYIILEWLQRKNRGANPKMLEELGVNVVPTVADLPEGAGVFVTGYDADYAELQQLKADGVPVIDRPCPWVRKLRDQILSFDNESYQMVLVIDENHMVYDCFKNLIPSDAIIVQPQNFKERICHLKLSRPLSLLSYTVFRRTDIEAMAEFILQEYPNQEHHLHNYKKTLCLWTKQGLFEEVEDKCQSHRLDEVWIICSNRGDRSTQSLIQQVEDSQAIPVIIEKVADIPSRNDKKKIGVLFAPIPKSTALLEIKQALITMAEQG